MPEVDRVRGSSRILLAVFTLLLAACGGHVGGGVASPTTKGKGKATIWVKWPAVSARLIPASAQSLVVTVRKGDAAVGTLRVKRPDASGTLTGLPYGTLAVEVKAYADADGTGVAQAVGTGTMVVTEETPGTVAVSLASTVTRLTIAPTTVETGYTTSVTAAAQDADGAIVPIGSETLTWTVDDAGVVTVSGTGLTATLRGVAPGSTTVYASMASDDAGGRVTGDGAVTVAAPSPSVTVSPAAATVDIGASTIFSATVHALPSVDVTWSADGGMIDAMGKFTAPSAVGTYTVTATSVADPSVKGTAQVMVKAVIKVSGPSFVGDLWAPQTYKATLVGLADQSVTWAASVGTMSPEGVYTPAQGDATVTITATSVTDPIVSGTLTVNVSSFYYYIGGGGGTLTFVWNSRDQKYEPSSLSKTLRLRASNKTLLSPASS